MNQNRVGIAGRYGEISHPGDIHGERLIELILAIIHTVERGTVQDNVGFMGANDGVDLTGVLDQQLILPGQDQIFPVESFPEVAAKLALIANQQYLHASPPRQPWAWTRLLDISIRGLCGGMSKIEPVMSMVRFTSSRSFIQRILE